MAKKLIANKVELKTPISKKENVLKVVDENGKNIEKFFEVGNELQPFVQEEIDKEILEQLQNNEEILPLGEPNVESNAKNVILDEWHIFPSDILNSVDSLQTIERGKLDLVKELILNSQNLEAISLLKSIQTAENWKVNEIISKL